MEKRHGLGKGLGALIPESTTGRPIDILFDGQENLSDVPGASFELIELDKIIANPKQPRIIFNDNELKELSLSIKEVGVQQPIVVRKRDDKFELVMGERRTRASRLAGLNYIPAIIKDTDDDELLTKALIENMHRANLNPIEEASAYKQLMEDFAFTQDILSKKLSKSRSQIANMLRILKLPLKVQKYIQNNQISFSAAKALMGISNPEKLENLAEEAAAGRLTVKEIESIVANPNNIPFNISAKKTSVKIPGIDDVAENIGDYLNTKVDIKLGKNKGKLEIHFSNGQDLNRILKIIVPEINGTPYA
ncbi:MAG: ParB/RepB/Spo0J family partition protein [Bifidobacteriaceae bacterium]|jgi:ParB family chromosome partitioning protein|nr:ParB/RepB/Spo0J family partition protein [Bifidobacteriaceae bacterium]